MEKDPGLEQAAVAARCFRLRMRDFFRGRSQPCEGNSGYPEIPSRAEMFLPPLRRYLH